ncbi:hypothetical protein [Lyngbya sp. CCY1209]|nr:hypothetical protein [Lyngbya sp. CCY1209]MEB3883566.1 hypothetical protein [Lyngbya sp. CCY1209]
MLACGLESADTSRTKQEENTEPIQLCSDLDGAWIGLSQFFQSGIEPEED